MRPMENHRLRPVAAAVALLLAGAAGAPAQTQSAPDPALQPPRTLEALRAQVESVVGSALAQGRSPEALDALVNEAAAEGKLFVPDRVRGPDGRVDTPALLALVGLRDAPAEEQTTADAGATGLSAVQPAPGATAPDTGRDPSEEAGDAAPGAERAPQTEPGEATASSEPVAGAETPAGTDETAPSGGIAAIQPEPGETAPEAAASAPADEPAQADETPRSTPEPERTVAATSEDTDIYVVREGDSLSGIAEKVYGDPFRYPEIFEANRDKLSSPNRVYIGQRLVIP